ncbi:MAG: ribonuclease HI [Desulfobacter sp.]|nr:ribonuclease HI [Desulfobacter sp.]
MSFKGNKVWVAHDSKNSLLLKKDRALIKYNLNQDYDYWVHENALKPEDQAVPAGQKKKKEQTLSPEQDPDVRHCIRIYTDGASSGNPGPSGIGVLLVYKDNRKEISECIGTATNNIAELAAIRRALSCLKRKDLPIRIYTDSAYAVGLLTQKWHPRTNQGLANEIKAILSTFDDIALIKVKGHAGIKENEVADFLATSAIKKGPS